jgi:hypothetical protein
MGMFSIRMMESSMVSIAKTAKARGMSQRQLVAQALEAIGVPMAEAEHMDRSASSRRRA